MEKALHDHVKISSHPCLRARMLGIRVSAPQSVLRIDVARDKMVANRAIRIYIGLACDWVAYNEWINLKKCELNRGSK